MHIPTRMILSDILNQTLQNHTYISLFFDLGNKVWSGFEHNATDIQMRVA